MNEPTSQQNKQRAAHITVRGRVQGVGFRHFTRTNAHRHGVVGWVRNNYDGTVEIWAEGTSERVKALIKAVRRGPSSAEVKDVDVKWTSPKGNFHSFQVHY